MVFPKLEEDDHPEERTVRGASPLRLMQRAIRVTTNGILNTENAIGICVISQKTIQKSVELLKKAADPVKIVLFGSYARGDLTEDSDIDFLIIEKEVKARRMEMVRLRDVLSPLRIPVDVLAISEKTYEAWKDTPDTVIYEAALEGRVVYGG